MYEKGCKDSVTFANYPQSSVHVNWTGSGQNTAMQRFSSGADMQQIIPTLLANSLQYLLGTPQEWLRSGWFYGPCTDSVGWNIQSAAVTSFHFVQSALNLSTGFLHTSSDATWAHHQWCILGSSSVSGLLTSYTLIQVTQSGVISPQLVPK